MNSQFKNSKLGFYLYALIILIIAFASIFLIWYMVKGYSLGTYEEDTILGSVYIGGLEEDEVEPKIEERKLRWLNDESVVFEITYQDYSYEFNRELFYFDFDLSMDNIVDGTTNKLFATYQGTEREDIVSEIENLDFLDGINDEFNFDTLMIDVLNDAAFMKSYSSRSLENYLIDYEDSISVIDQPLTLNLYEGLDVEGMIAGINEVYPDGRILVGSKELFDIIENLGGSLADNEMSIISTGMLALILETNFSVNEVHYVSEIDYINFDIDTYPYFGHNSSINQVVGNSFSFYNPNNSSYYFEVEKDTDTSITITLRGLSFVDDIEVVINKIVLEHITQYTSDEDILQNGYDGAIIEAVRTITNIEGIITYENVILFEFYTPIKEIVIEP